MTRAQRPGDSNELFDGGLLGGEAGRLNALSFSVGRDVTRRGLFTALLVFMASFAVVLGVRMALPVHLGRGAAFFLGVALPVVSCAVGFVVAIRRLDRALRSEVFMAVLRDEVLAQIEARMAQQAAETIAPANPPAALSPTTIERAVRTLRVAAESTRHLGAVPGVRASVPE